MSAPQPFPQRDQWDGTEEAYATICQFMGVSMLPRTFIGSGVRNLHIRTLESGSGEHIASCGDWIIRGVAGEFYACKPDIFAATYEPVGRAASGEPPREPSEEAIKALVDAMEAWFTAPDVGGLSRMAYALRAAYAAEGAAPRAPRAPDEPHQKEECPRCEGRGILPRDLDGPNVHPYCTLCGGTGFVVRTVSRGAPEP